MSFLKVCKREIEFLKEFFFQERFHGNTPGKGIPGCVTQEEHDLEREQAIKNDSLYLALDLIHRGYVPEKSKREFIFHKLCKTHNMSKFTMNDGTTYFKLLNSKSCSTILEPTPAIMANGEICYAVWERPTPSPRIISE